MLIEKIWPYLPTPIIYAVILAVALVALFSVDHAIMAMAFLWVIAIAFVVSTWTISRPFHVERLAIMLTLAIAHASLFAVNLQEVYAFLHLHDEDSMMIARVVYSIIWLLVTGASLFSYAHNTGRGVARIWPAIAIVTFIAAVFPIEPDAFIVTQPAWTWLLRLHAAFTLFMIIALGDSASVLAALYRDRADSFRRGHRVKEPSQSDMDISLVRTLLWSPIVLWVMFVPRVLLLVLIPLGAYLIYITYKRWGLANIAHLNFVHTLSNTTDEATEVPIDTIVDVMSTLDTDELNYVINKTLGVSTIPPPTSTPFERETTTTTTRNTEEKRRHRRRGSVNGEATTATTTAIVEHREKRRKKTLDAPSNSNMQASAAFYAVDDM